jgi:hypothetical protein
MGPRDYDVMDGDRVVGRIFLEAHGAWFWARYTLLSRKRTSRSTRRSKPTGDVLADRERLRLVGPGSVVLGLRSLDNAIRVEFD